MFDIVIIGAGVIGLSIAKAIGEKTKSSVLVIEKEDSFGKGISSRNSEVIHSGIYYSYGSLKSKYCVEGRKNYTITAQGMIFGTKIVESL